MKKLIVLLVMSLSGSVMATEFSCIGTEPFWGLKITNTHVTLSRENVSKTEPVLSKISAIGATDNFAFVVTSVSGTATVIRGECSDGMSDKLYSHHTVLKSGPIVVAGCCDQVN